MSYGCDDFFKPQNTLRQLLNIPNDPARRLMKLCTRLTVQGKEMGKGYSSSFITETLSQRNRTLAAEYYFIRGVPTHTS